MAKKTFNIGLVGYGFMGRTHSNAFLQAPRYFDLPYEPVLKAVSARNRERVEAFAANWGYRIGRDRLAGAGRSPRHRSDRHRQPERYPRRDRDRRGARRQDGDVREAARPNGRRGRSDGRAVESAGVPNSVWYNYRRVPAVVLLRQLIEEGKLGRIFHYRAKFLQDWTISRELPQGGEGLWRLDVSVAGSGVTGDLLAHCIDTAMWLNGPIDERDRDDRDIRQRAQAHRHGQSRAGRHRRCVRVSVAVRQRLAGDVRIDALRARAQGALHARDQRRARLGRLGSARPASSAVVRSSRRRSRRADGAACMSPTATIRT